jgi:glutamyl-tRNA synthetase
MKERVTLLPEFWQNGAYFFQDISEYDNEKIKKSWKPENRPRFEKMLELVAALDNFESANVETCVKTYLSDENLKPGEVLPIWRLALCGSMHGPAVFDVAELLGKKETLKRWDTGMAYFDTVLQYA